MSQSWQLEPAAILNEQLKVGDHEALMLESWPSTSSLWWGLVLKVKILKYSSLMLCMYAPVSIRKCLTCVFSVFHVKKKENGSCYSHFWRWGETQAFILLPLCCFFYPQCTENVGAWPSFHCPLGLPHLSQKQSLKGGGGISFSVHRPLVTFIFVLCFQ